MSETRFGPVQLRIMRVLWQRRRATAREITDALNEEETIAHSTVQTLLRKLEEKGSITHDVEDRTFVYRSLVDEKKATRKATRDLIDRVFDGRAAGLVSYLLEEETLSANELKALRDLIEQKKSDNRRSQQ